MIAVWLLVLIGGIVGASLGSRRAVSGALQIADSLNVPVGLVGVTLMAIGTDLPEIANSISASLGGHGDLNVGDSTGSALTQVTLIAAILVAASPTLVERAGSEAKDLVAPVGFLTVVATLVIAFLISDEVLSRSDGVVLIAIWAATMVYVGRTHRYERTDTSDREGTSGRVIVSVLVALGFVAVSAVAVVRAFVELSDAFGVPELVASTVVLALGTSLPELVVDWTAVRRGAASLAIGDLFGSSLVDASLSIGIGPVFRSTTVSAEAVVSVLIVALGVAAATITWYAVPDRRALKAGSLGAIYFVAMAAILFWAT